MEQVWGTAVQGADEEPKRKSTSSKILLFSWKIWCTLHTTFFLTVVYGPTLSSRKQAFLQELQQLKLQPGLQWLLLGDFNLIYKASDKNNNRLNTRLMRCFREVLDECDLREIHLQNRKFTWSNERQNPTQAKLDRIFCNEEWDTNFSSHVLHALSTSLSDHCPLLLSNQNGPRRPNSFKFENFWDYSASWAIP